MEIIPKIFIVLAALTASWFYFKPIQQPGTIILLNGTSSAGKTEIVKEWYKMYGDSYETILNDDFVHEYAIKHPADTYDAAYCLEMNSAFFLHIKNLSLKGKNVIVDTVGLDEHYDHFCAILECDKILKVLVYCPLDKIVDRVAQRNKSENKQEHRTTNQIMPQFKDIYKLQDSADEIIVDRVKTSSIQYALQVAIKEMRQQNKNAGKDPEENMQPFVKLFEEQFKLNTVDEIILVPQHSWDLIVNTGIQSPVEIAQTIAQQIKEFIKES